MSLGITDRVELGRRAIALASRKGIDTESWAEHLYQLLAIEYSQLLGWAAQLAELEVILPMPVTYIDGSFKEVRTSHISRAIRSQLNTVVAAKLSDWPSVYQPFTLHLWDVKRKEAIESLKSLQDAVGTVPGLEDLRCLVKG